MRLAELAAISPGMARSGRGAGARPGDWTLSLVESRNLRDGRLDLDGLRRVGVVRNAWSERHLLRPYDVLVTARAESVQVALTPPSVSRTAAGATVLVVRAKDPGSGLAHWLRLYLGSGIGRAAIRRRMTTGVATPLLTAAGLGELETPVPPPRRLRTIPALVESLEAAREAEVRASLGREALVDALVADLGGGGGWGAAAAGDSGSERLRSGSDGRDSGSAGLRSGSDGQEPGSAWAARGMD